MSASASRCNARGWRWLAALLLLTLALAPGVRAEPVTAALMQGLVEEHGKKVLVDVLMKARHGQMTIVNGGAMKDVWGRPRLDLVTPATLSRDARKAGLDRDGLAERLSRHADVQARSKRRSSAGIVQAVIPLANLKPDLRVRGARRTWKVEELIEDAERYHDHISADLNTVRQREAYRRNARLERILIGWQTQHGSADMSVVERKLLREAQQALSVCRGLDRKRQKAQWIDNDCDAATAPAATRVNRRLRDRLRAPFDDYWAAVKPFL